MKWSRAQVRVLLNPGQRLFFSNAYNLVLLIIWFYFIIIFNFYSPALLPFLLRIFSLCSFFPKWFKKCLNFSSCEAHWVACVYELCTNKTALLYISVRETLSDEGLPSPAAQWDGWKCACAAADNFREQPSPGGRGVRTNQTATRNANCFGNRQRSLVKSRRKDAERSRGPTCLPSLLSVAHQINHPTAWRNTSQVSCCFLPTRRTWNTLNEATRHVDVFKRAPKQHTCTSSLFI